MVEPILCELCGAVAKYPVKKTIDGCELYFCCAGCLQVYELTREEGQSAGAMPAQAQIKPAIPVDRSHAGTTASKIVTLPIVGMSCENCVAHVGGGLRRVPGVINVNVSLATESAVVEITPDAVTISDLKHAVKSAGYEALDPVD